MTEAQKRLSDENYRYAWLYLKEENILPPTANKAQYAIRHKDPSLESTNLERFIEWRISDIEIIKLDSPLKGVPKSKEHRRKIAEALKGNGCKPPSHKGLKWKLVDGKRKYYREVEE